MCGIAGVVSDRPDAQSHVGSMLELLRHRGPDDEGIATSGRATLGVRRLSIIDVEHGHQPMSDESGEVLAVQNGEIYNFMELRDELAALGHTFRTRSDTEVLPHAYREWGPEFVSRLRGMFALAVWDDRSQTLLLARDRFGKKPLHVAMTRRGLFFASELRALLLDAEIRADLNDEALATYFVLGFIPAPLTAFSSIQKLRPGELMIAHGAEATFRRYWQPQFLPKLEIPFDEAVAHVRSLIEDAVKVRLISDVPVGAFLSGGLDSSTVVANMAMHAAAPVKTFSIGFRDTAHDESRYARLVAERFHTEHHELVVDAADADVLPMLVQHLGEPFADGSIVPTFHVARATRGFVTVALSGDGGDELFGGYDRYRAEIVADALDKTPLRPALGVVAGVARAIPVSAAVPRLLQRARRFGIELGASSDSRRKEWSAFFVGGLRSALIGERLKSCEPETIVDGDASLSGVERYIASDISRYLPDDLLVKVDIASMACSLEVRAPMLDHKLADFVLRLPVSYRVSAWGTKRLLRRAMRGIVPDEVLDRRRKMGFTAPIGTWLRGPLSGFVTDLFTRSRAADRGLIEAGAARLLVRQHIAGAVDRANDVWALVMLELWLREVVDRPPE